MRGKKGDFLTPYSRGEHVGEIDADHYEDQRGACQVEHRRGNEVQPIGGGEDVNSIALHWETGVGQVEENAVVEVGREGGREGGEKGRETFSRQMPTLNEA